MKLSSEKLPLGPAPLEPPLADRCHLPIWVKPALDFSPFPSPLPQLFLSWNRICILCWKLFLAPVWLIFFAYISEAKSMWKRMKKFACISEPKKCAPWTLKSSLMINTRIFGIEFLQGQASKRLRLAGWSMQSRHLKKIRAHYLFGGHPNSLYKLQVFFARPL